MDSIEFIQRDRAKLDKVPYPCIIWVRADSIGSQKEHLFIQVEAPLTINTTTELPMNFQFEGVEFSRYCGFYYLPTQKTEEEFATFWDFLGEKYDQMTDPELHGQIYAILANMVKDIPNSTLKILDIGVGTGIYTKIVPSKLENKEVELYGVDISEEMVTLAAQKGIISKKISNNLLPYSDAFFDAIISCFTPHLYDNFKPFEEWFRVLQGPGRIAFNHRYPDHGFQKIYDQNLRSIGFIDVETKIYHIVTANKEWDIWFTSASKQ